MNFFRPKINSTIYAYAVVMISISIFLLFFAKIAYLIPFLIYLVTLYLVGDILVDRYNTINMERLYRYLKNNKPLFIHNYYGRKSWDLDRGITLVSYGNLHYIQNNKGKNVYLFGISLYHKYIFWKLDKLIKELYEDSE